MRNSEQMVHIKAYQGRLKEIILFHGLRTSYKHSIYFDFWSVLMVVISAF